MDDVVPYNPIIGSSILTKYIPYELFLDMKEQFDLKSMLDNRISVCIEHTGLYNVFELENILIKNYIDPVKPMSGRWTFMSIDKGDTYRVEMMFEDKNDFDKITSEVIILDKLTRE